MPRYAQNINSIYISERMQENLRHIKECFITSMVAPMGYGKSTAAYWYLEERQKRGDAVFHINIYSSDVNLFWQSFCNAFRNTELGERLKGMDFPVGQTAVNMLIQDIEEYLNTLEKEVFLLIDDCHLMEDGSVFSMLFAMCDIPTHKLHIILASRSVLFLCGEELHLGSKLHKIVANDLRLNRAELSAYLRRCGVELPDEEAETLFRNSEGWFSCVYLNLCNYAKNGALLSKGEDIYSMIGEALYAGYNNLEQHFLIDMCSADEFTVEQAEFITESSGVKKLIKTLAQNNAFIRYLPDTDTYRFHHMLKGYVEKIFARLPEEQRWNLEFRYGKWHESQGQFIQAIQFYRKANAMPELLHVIGLDCGVQLASISPDKILAVLSQCSEKELMSEPQSLLVLMRRMFTCRQIPKMLELKDILTKAASCSALSREERGNLLGECDLIMSFLRYNDISAMSKLHISASRLMTRKAISIQKNGSFTFSSPSVLMMFHRESGKLDSEIEEMNRSMPFYYQITDGHGIGAEQIMEAEALFLRGQLDEAHIMLEKAKTTVNGTGQYYILLCCELLSLRLALCGKLPYQKHWYEEKTKLFKTLRDPMLYTVLDGCAAYVYALLEQCDQIPEWIREGKLADANILSPGRPMYEVIYNQILLLQKQYAVVLGRGDALLEACRGMHYLLCEIHLHIQLAIANDAMGRTEEVQEHLQLAFTLALPDGILMPFVENGRMLKPILEQMPLQYTDAIYHISNLYRMMESSQTSPQNLLNTLTEREKRIAALYASGKTRREIAEQLFLSEGTVRNYITNVYAKLHLAGTPKQKQHALTQIVTESKK